MNRININTNIIKKIAAAILLCILLAFIIYFIRPQACTTVPAPPTHRYVFKDYNGRVACYEEGAKDPFLVTDVVVNDLTELDREMLGKGVVVSGAKAMSRALEDYTA